MRVGRGVGSSKGKTAGRGHKGKKARSGRGPHPDYEGGSAPLYKKIRKYGFKNGEFKREYEWVNLDKLQQWIDRGRIDPSRVITMKTLVECGLLRRVKQGVKLLGKGAENFKTPINIEITSASKLAEEAVLNAGGQLKRVFYNRVNLHHLMKPWRFDVVPKRGLPPRKIAHRFDEPKLPEPEASPGVTAKQ